MCAFLNYYTKTIVSDASKKQVARLGSASLFVWI